MCLETKFPKILIAAGSNQMQVGQVEFIGLVSIPLLPQISPIQKDVLAYPKSW